MQMWFATRFFERYTDITSSHKLRKSQSVLFGYVLWYVALAGGNQIFLLMKHHQILNDNCLESFFHLLLGNGSYMQLHYVI